MLQPAKKNEVEKKKVFVKRIDPTPLIKMSDHDKKETLKQILDGDSDTLDVQIDDDPVELSNGQEQAEGEEDINYCIECRDMPTEIYCNDCVENFCKPCFQMIHKNGKRKTHKTENVETHLIEEAKNEENGDIDIDGDAEEAEETEESEDYRKPHSIEEVIMNGIKRQVKYIPMRLTVEERKLLRLLQAALNVSEYTDKIDILSYTSKLKRIVVQLKEICSILIGLTISSDFKKGTSLIDDKNFEDNAEFFQKIFEIGRRYKIMNPEKLRDNFGKLMYMVMDSRLPEIRDHMEFDLYTPIKTVASYLESKEKTVLNMFDDILIVNATAEISPIGKSRYQIERDIKTKESAIKKLSERYSNKKISKDEICQVLYSIGDFNSYINTNRKPIIRMLKRLEQFEKIDSLYKLNIKFGVKGARLTHDHSKQFQYVYQSLQLWSLIQREMIKLWSLLDDDLLSPTLYKLQNTGQGLNRVKPSPQVSRYMYKILTECQREARQWIGSSVVHLGDYTVPNSLFFLDKYIQVPRILIPIDATLNKIDELYRDPNMRIYIDLEYGSLKDLELTILQDFFSFAFDGSGTNDFYSSGSCIDGRLTSAWNWANEVHKKKYFNIFLLTGFVGFNGNEGF